MIILKHNGTSLSNFIVSNPIKDTLDEELDQFNFQINSDTRLLFRKNDKIEYEIKHGNTTILSKVFSLFSVNETLGGEVWTYTIQCLSATKILENIIINGMAETYYPEQNGTLYQQMNLIRQKINSQLFHQFGYSFTISFDNTITSETLSDPANDFLWDGQVNAREIFNDMLSKADALIIGKDFTISNQRITAITLGMEKKEKVGTNILTSNNDVESGGLDAVSSVIKGITYSRNSEYNCGNIISLMKNGIAKDNIQQPFLSARNTELTIDNKAQWHIITSEPIYSLNKVVALLPIQNAYLYYWKHATGSANWEVKLFLSSLSNSQQKQKILIPFDITNYVVEKSVFDAMPITQQARYFYFIRGQKGIYNIFDKYKSGATGLISLITIRNMLDYIIGHDGMQSLVPNSNDVINWDSYGFGTLLYGDSSWNFTKMTGYIGSEVIPYISTTGNKAEGALKSVSVAGAVPNEDSAYYGSLFSVNYQPYCDSVVRIEKTTLENSVSENLSILKNQSDRTIDAEKYFTSQQSLINRLGNQEMTLDAMVDLTETYSYNSSLWNLGDYFMLNSKKWTITQRKIEMFGIDKLKISYQLSKNYNSSNASIQLNRDKRLYGIPLNQYVDRYIFVKTDRINNPKWFIESWDDFTGGTTTRGYCLLETSLIGNDDIKHRVARMLDNYASDIERTKSGSTIVNVYVRYCDEDTGRASYIYLKSCSEETFKNLNISDYSRLPFIPRSDDSTAFDNMNTEYISGIDKDKMERLIFVFTQ